MQHLDLENAFRRLRRSPGSSLAAVLTLSLGMSAPAALLTIAETVLFRPLPYSDPERLVTLPTVGPSGGQFISAPMFWDLQTQAETLEAVTIQRPTGLEPNTPGRPERIPALEVSAGYFELLGYRPARGRFFQRPDEDDGQAAVVLGYGLWLRAFGGDPGIVGRSVLVDRRFRTVLGIAPKDLELPWNRSADVFVPVDRTREDTRERLHYNYTAFGRLRPGVDLEAAQLEMSGIFRAWLRGYPKMSPEAVLTAQDLRAFLVGSSYQPMLLLLSAVCLLLLIACTNVVGLFLSRSFGRQREVALRRALGAGEGDLFRQHLAESLLVGVSAAFCSLPLVGAGAEVDPAVAARRREHEWDQAPVGECRNAGLPGFRRARNERVPGFSADDPAPHLGAGPYPPRPRHRGRRRGSPAAPGAHHWAGGPDDHVSPFALGHRQQQTESRSRHPAVARVHVPSSPTAAGARSGARARPRARPCRWRSGSRPGRGSRSGGRGRAARGWPRRS